MKRQWENLQQVDGGSEVRRYWKPPRHSQRPTIDPIHFNPPVSMKGHHRGGSSPPPSTHIQPQHRNPVPGNSIKGGGVVLEDSRPLKTLHCLWKASPHHGCSMCNTVRGLAHYCWPRFHFVPFVWLTGDSSCPAGPVKESPVALKEKKMRKRIRFARLGTCNTPVQTMHGLIINLRGLECAVISGAWGVFKIGHSHHELDYWLTDRPQHRVCVNVRAIHYHIKEALWSAPPQPLLLSFSAPPQLLSDTAGEYKSFPLRCSLKGLTIQFQTHRTQTMALSKCEKIKSWPFWIRRHNQELTLPKCCRKNVLVFFFSILWHVILEAPANRSNREQRNVCWLHQKSS